jgi:hypothetical protein
MVRAASLRCYRVAVSVAAHAEVRFALLSNQSYDLSAGVLENPTMLSRRSASGPFARVRLHELKKQQVLLGRRRGSQAQGD